MNMVIFLVLFYLFLFPFGQLNRLPVEFLGSEVNLYLTDIVATGAVSCWLGWKLVKRKKFVFPLLTKPIFLFSGLAFLSLIFSSPLLSGREVVVSGLYLIRWLVYAGFYFLISDLVNQPKKKKLRSKRLILNLLIGAGTILAIFGFLQYFFLPNTKFLKYLHWDPHYYRLIGTFLDPAFLGMILVLSLILLVFKYWQEITRPKKSLPIYCLLPVLYLALILTHSRSSYLAYLVGMGVIAWKKKAVKFFLAVLLIFILTLSFLPQPEGEGGKLTRTYTIDARIRNWQQSLVIARDHFLLGVGFNTYRYAQRRYGFLEEDWQFSHAGAGADSSFLFVLATTGIFGLSAYLWLWLKILKINAVVIQASALALLTHSLFSNSLFYPWIMAWLWILVGIFQKKDSKENN